MVPSQIRAASLLTLSVLLVPLGSSGKCQPPTFQVQYTSLQCLGQRSGRRDCVLAIFVSAIATFPLDKPPGSSSLRPLQQSRQCKILHQYDSCYGSFDPSRYRTLGPLAYMCLGIIIGISKHHFALIGPNVPRTQWGHLQSRTFK